VCSLYVEAKLFSFSEEECILNFPAE